MTDIGRLEPAYVRHEIRAGAWTGVTTGAALGHVQANLVVVPGGLAAEFADFCTANPRPLPLLEATAPGRPDDLTIAPGADIRTDLPSFDVHRHGELAYRTPTLRDLWGDDLVAFLLGCSFSAENQLLRAGVTLRHLDESQSVPIFVTSLACEAVGGFHGPVVVSMRPIRKSEVERATDVTARLPLAHGAPLHVGDPSAIGIADLSKPDWGDVLLPREDEVPVFWACGVTPQAVIRAVRPELAITHTPGHMFITDLTDDDIVDRTALGPS